MKIHDVRQFINSSSEFFTILKHLPAIDSDGPWVAGGSVWKSIENIPLECDIDVFFKSDRQCEKWFRTLLSLPYAHRIVSDPKSNQYNTSLKYHVHHKGYNKTITLQLVSFRFFDNIKALLDGFDFTACQFGFDGNALYSGDTSLDDLRNREIIFNNVLDNVATGIHIEKYTKIGFKIPASQKQRYDEIMEKTKTFRDRIPSPEPSPSFISRWATTLEPAVSTPRPVAVDEDYAYPRPANTGINLSRITQTPQFTRPAPRPSSLWASVDSSPDVSAQNPCVEAPIYGNTQTQASPGVYTREIDRSLYTTETISIPMDYVTTAGTDSQNTPGINIAEEFIGEPITESNRIETIRQEVESILTPSLAEYSRTLSDEEIISIRNGSRITTVENSTSSINSIER